MRRMPSSKISVGAYKSRFIPISSSHEDYMKFPQASYQRSISDRFAVSIQFDGETSKLLRELRQRFGVNSSGLARGVTHKYTDVTLFQLPARHESIYVDILTCRLTGTGGFPLPCLPPGMI